jgi:hypothetical protein
VEVLFSVKRPSTPAKNNRSQGLTGRKKHLPPGEPHNISEIPISIWNETQLMDMG